MGCGLGHHHVVVIAQSNAAHPKKILAPKRMMKKFNRSIPSHAQTPIPAEQDSITSIIMVNYVSI
jgi:hypothetical protein